MAWQQKYKADDLIDEWKFEKFDRFHLWLRSYRFVQLHNEELKIATLFQKILKIKLYSFNRGYIYKCSLSVEINSTKKNIGENPRLFPLN